MLTDFGASFSDSNSPPHSSGPHFSTIKTPSSNPIALPFAIHNLIPRAPYPSICSLHALRPCLRIPRSSLPHPLPPSLGLKRRPSDNTPNLRSRPPSYNSHRLLLPWEQPVGWLTGRQPHLDSYPYHLSLLLLGCRCLYSPARRGRSEAGQVQGHRGRRHPAATRLRVTGDGCP